MTGPRLDAAAPAWLHLFSAFLAMEPSDWLVSLARECGGGSVTEEVQRFIWNHCITKAMVDQKVYTPYLRNILKKLIIEVESKQGDVLDELYEQYAYIMTSFKDDHSRAKRARVCKYISFIFPDGCLDLPSCPESKKLVVQLQCSLNMLEGGTGCWIWPSSFLMAEFILSFPHIFSNKSCLELGAGVGLVGVCLAHVKASKVTLTDGDPLTLANLRSNLELNKLHIETDESEGFAEVPDVVKCIYLPWESSSESEIAAFTPEIIVGADILYDRSCFSDLVRVLSILLNQSKPLAQKEISQDHISESIKSAASMKKPVAYIASVIRNIDTFNYFLQLAEQASLTVTYITETQAPFNLLPYMQSYQRSTIRLLALSY